MDERVKHLLDDLKFRAAWKRDTGNLDDDVCDKIIQLIDQISELFDK